MTAIRLSAEEARHKLIAHLRLARPFGKGHAAIRALLAHLRCIQLDPLDVIGANADLVVLARIDGVLRGDVWRALFPGHAFEHWAKERCLLPAYAFPFYRERAAEAPWWRHSDRERRVPPDVVEAVLEEVRRDGPATARALTDHGAVEAFDWSGWKGTGKATTMALEVLWTRCDVVVAGRTESGSKLYDIPTRALPRVAGETPSEEFSRWALRERAAAAGLLSRAGGATWSMLASQRTTALPDQMIAAGELVEIAVEGSNRPYLASPEFLDVKKQRYDDRIRIIGPLDPLVWDRSLLRTAFDFDYIWEVYKPAAQRRWGWYVCPLLQRDRFIGRLEARVEDGVLRVHNLWPEVLIDREALAIALERHAVACGATRVTISRAAAARMRRRSIARP